MKQARRKELKTNELSQYLHQIYDGFQRNQNYILIGAFAVVIVLVLATVVRQRMHARSQEAWDTYYSLRIKDVTEQPETLDQVRDLANREAGDSQLGPLVLQLQAEKAFDLASSLTDSKDAARRTELLNQARSTYKELVSRYADREDVQARAHYGLAGTDESLAAFGRGTLPAGELTELQNEARQSYQYIVDHPSSFSDLARQQLANFDERMQPVKIVATRPAEPLATPPASQPAGQPAINLGGDTIRVPLGGNAPK